MVDFKHIEAVYFIGIGGIGMSAIARYLLAGGFPVYGYDRTSGPVTDALISEGCIITFEDDEKMLPGIFLDNNIKEKMLVVITPAIPNDNRIFSYFRKNGYGILKRSEILGMISRECETIAVSGTHGKTTVSTMLAHILKQSGADCSAFLGGISKNYNSNLLIGESRLTVMEADEYDRSFHRLLPSHAICTSVDPDHLEIYGDHESMIEGYNIFFEKIKDGGLLVVNRSITEKIRVPEGLTCITYGSRPGADWSYSDVVNKGECYSFSLKGPNTEMHDILFPFPGRINIENATAASAMAISLGVTEQELRKALYTFSGVQRRFDIRVRKPGLTYIDDYAHHPEEIKAFVDSVREYFGSRKITGIFQPHLFTRTRDHAEGFAETLDKLDETILLPVYPAREEPIPGVSSDLIFKKMKSVSKRMAEKNEVLQIIDKSDIDVLVTIGAGDIDRLAQPITEILERRSK